MTRRWGRRRLLEVLGSGAAIGTAGCLDTIASDDRESDAETLSKRVGLETIATGLNMPIDIAFLPDVDLRYIATQPGEVFIHDSDGLRDALLLDLSDRIVTGYEMGLLGIELHPEFPDNRRLFARYSAPIRDGTPDDYNHTFVLSEFEVTDDGTRASLGSERTVMEIPQPEANHNSGDIVFGPDGYLYVPTGDGGGANDTAYDHPDDWYDAIPGGNGQDTTDLLLGGILRIDVDREPTEPPQTEGDVAVGDEAAGYAIPDDNPLVDFDGHRDEYYAWGLRNPWRTSFDAEDYFVGDVCQDGWEKVYRVERGGNYGWNVKEGSHCLKTDECPDETPEDVRGGEALIDPIIEYPHRGPTSDAINGVTVIGGYVYRGSAIGEFADHYIFGDLNPHGRLFAGIPSNEGGADGSWRPAKVELTEDAAATLEQLLAFGRDDAGELYALGSGGVHEIVPAE